MPSSIPRPQNTIDALSGQLQKKISIYGCVNRRRRQPRRVFIAVIKTSTHHATTAKHDSCVLFGQQQYKIITYDCVNCQRRQPRWVCCCFQTSAITSRPQNTIDVFCPGCPDKQTNKKLTDAVGATTLTKTLYFFFSETTAVPEVNFIIDDCCVNRQGDSRGG